MAVETLRMGAGAAVRSAAPWIVGLGRFGCAAKGAVYVVLGALALRAAFWGAKRAGGKSEALREILAHPFGKTCLAVLTVGLFGYAIWRLVQAVRDTDGHGTSPHGILKRVAAAGSGLVYGSVAITAMTLLRGLSVASDDATARSKTATLMQAPGGRMLVGAAGVVLLVLAIVQIRRAWKCTFMQKLDLGGARETARKAVRAIGRLGLGARAVVFAIVGWFLLDAAMDAAPGKARGLGGALTALARQPYGQMLLAIVALGLTAYGVYMFVEARYRRIVVR